MLSTTDMKYYTDPIVTPDLKAKSILVSQVKYDRHSNLIGQVVNVKGHIVEHTKVWWVTEGGNYVTGPSVGSQAVARYSVVLAKYGDMFVCGETARRRSATDPVRLLHNIRTSTGESVPHGGYLPVTEWVKAASWAHEYMPVAGDSPEVIAAKLACAKRQWEIRYAKSEIMAEGVVREWTEDLKRLQKAGVMYTGMYGAFCTGTALIPVSTAEVKLTDYSQQVIDNIKKSRAGKKDSKEVVYAGVPVEFFAQMETTLESAKAPNAEALGAYVRTETGSSMAQPGPMTYTPVLMSVY